MRPSSLIPFIDRDGEKPTRDEERTVSEGERELDAGRGERSGPDGRGGQSGPDDVTARNISGFDSDVEVDRYDRKVRDGLLAAEREVVDRYYEPGDAVLDVGCGVGRTTVQLDERGMNVVGVDVSRGQIARARERFPELTLGVGDAVDLVFPDDAFDHVLFSNNGLDCIHPESARLDALRELRRVLDPNGTLAFSSRNMWYRFPALLFDRGFVSRYYLTPTNRRRLFDPYKRIEDEGGTFELYSTTPRRQFTQLRECGFRPLAIVGKRRGIARFFENRPYYVATPASE
ncbi:class I SAM-dependent methyltransferase [Halorubrum trueperi]|uniref:Class I SAM-dependent methyltransferase n=1 Tax=Halorubrum trueperi TaxID=2004704 RepID=A0ABD5UMS9_9EURY